ncbi:MAG: hypothetical protein ABIP51_08280, partial [Bacteroidia bacterium]
TKKTESFSDSSHISNVIEENTVSNYAELMDLVVKDPLIGKIKSFSTSKIEPSFSKNNHSYYSSNNIHDEKGSTYSYERRFKLIEKIDDKNYLIELEPNKFQSFSISVEREFLKEKTNSSELKWIKKGYTLSSSKLYLFENDEIEVKSAKNIYKGKYFTKDELLKFDFKRITVQLKNGKFKNLLNR